MKFVRLEYQMHRSRACSVPYSLWFTAQYTFFQEFCARVPFLKKKFYD